jgi:hypothetical protein
MDTRGVFEQETVHPRWSNNSITIRQCPPYGMWLGMDKQLASRWRQFNSV